MYQNDIKKVGEQPPSASYDGEFDLLELVEEIFKHKYKIIFSTFVFCILSTIYALYQPNIYKSESLVISSESSGSGGQLAAIAGQLGGLASMAGINLGSKSGNTEEAMAVLKSRDFIVKFVRDNDLLVPLFALRPVPFSKTKLEIDGEVYDSKAQKWVRKVSLPFTQEPTDWEIYESFSKVFRVNKDNQTGLIVLSVTWYDPVQAQRWVKLLIRDINTHMKLRDMKEAEKSIDFIKNMISQTSLVDVRSIYLSLIEAHTKTIVLAEVREEYVFRVVDSAMLPLKKSGPKRSVICILGAILGFFISVFTSLLFYFGRKVPQSVFQSK